MFQRANYKKNGKSTFLLRRVKIFDQMSLINNYLINFHWKINFPTLNIYCTKCPCIQNSLKQTSQYKMSLHQKFQTQNIPSQHVPAYKTSQKTLPILYVSAYHISQHNTFRIQNVPAYKTQSHQHMSLHNSSTNYFNKKKFLHIKKIHNKYVVNKKSFWIYINILTQNVPTTKCVKCIYSTVVDKISHQIQNIRILSHICSSILLYVTW